jgi:hypothetical protein
MPDTGNKSTDVQSREIFATSSGKSIMTSDFAINSNITVSRLRLTPKVIDCKGFKYFKMNDPNISQFRKISPDELDDLFNPNKDKRLMKNLDVEFNEETKISLLEDINKQYVVDRVFELKAKRGMVADVTGQTVPHVPKIVQNICRSHIRSESMKSPIRYKFKGDGKIVTVLERKDKQILKTLPKLKFLNKTGIKPDYENKDIERPQRRIKVSDFSYSSRKHVPKKSEIISSLDNIDPHKLLKDKFNISPG